GFTAGGRNRILTAVLPATHRRLRRRVRGPGRSRPRIPGARRRAQHAASSSIPRSPTVVGGRRFRGEAYSRTDGASTRGSTRPLNVMIGMTGAVLGGWLLSSVI